MAVGMWRQGGDTSQTLLYYRLSVAAGGLAGGGAGGVAVTPGLLVLSKTDLDTRARGTQGSGQSDRDFFRLTDNNTSNNNNNNRKVRLRQNNNISFIHVLFSVFFHP